MIEISSIIDESLSVDGNENVELHLATSMEQLRKMARNQAGKNFVIDTERTTRRICHLFEQGQVNIRGNTIL